MAKAVARERPRRDVGAACTGFVRLLMPMLALALLLTVAADGGVGAAPRQSAGRTNLHDPANRLARERTQIGSEIVWRRTVRTIAVAQTVGRSRRTTDATSPEAVVTADREPRAFRRGDRGTFVNETCSDGRFNRFLRFKGMILDAIECEAFAYLGPMWGPGQQILDVGAGSGEVAEYLENKYGVQITAIDVLPPSKNYYGTKQGNKPSGHKVGVFNGHDLAEFSNSSFDVVMINMVLHHAAKHAPNLLLEASRVAAKWILLLEDTAVDIPFITKRNRQHDPKGIFRPKEEWRALIQSGGFLLVEEAPIGNTTGFGTSAKESPEKAKDRARYQRYFVAERPGLFGNTPARAGGQMGTGNGTAGRGGSGGASSVAPLVGLNFKEGEGTVVTA